MRQFASTVKKNSIEKRRNIRVTCCECLSHLVMFVILLLGLSLSKLVYFQPENYVKLNVELPPSFLTSSQLSLVTDDPSNPSSGGNSGRSSKTDGSRAINVGSLLAGVRRTLKGPMPIPPFDVYVAVAKYVTNIARNTPVTGLLLQTSLGMKYGNLLDLGDLHFAPYPSAAVDSLVAYLNRTTTSFRTLKSHFHANENDGVNYILTNLDRRALALISIRQITPEKINYVIRQNYTTLPNTNNVFISITRGLDRTYQMYLLSGFLTLESTIDRWALNYAVRQADPSASCQSPDVLTVPFPTYEFDSNPFYSQVGFLLGLAMTMSTLYPVSRLVKSVVEEKETRMREIMKIMGLSQFAHQFSWFFTAFVLFFWMSISSTFIAHISFLPNTNILILFFYFFLFHMSEISLSFLIAVFFSNSKLAAIVGPVILFITILPKYIFFGSNSNEESMAKYAASLLSPTAFTFGADILADYEYSKVGVQFSNIGDNNFSMISVFQMMFLDIFIYGFLAWYFDQTLSYEFGTPKHFLFILNPYYWCPCLKKCSFFRPMTKDRLRLMPAEMRSQSTSTVPMAEIVNPRQSIDAPEGFQPPTSQRTLSVDAGPGCDLEDVLAEPRASNINQYQLANIRNDNQGNISRSNSNEVGQQIDYCDSDIEMLSENQLCDVKVIARGMEKRYPNGKVAVKDFSLAMLEGQITCLLGHNGAGKSSVIAMITGLTTITAGECVVYDQPLPAALSEIRTMTGICPQQNVLFPTLTVREHLRFFGCIKGSHGKKLLEAVDQMIVDVGLSSKRDTPASSLSGGMKRKLQLAIALIGGSKFLILDEPTSGMDPFSRRATWELLQKHKAGRVILLTTHFLEEADILGDRIAIMSEGHVRCSGSSLFLKTRFGAGYLLSISMTQAATLRERKLKKRSLENEVNESHSPFSFEDIYKSPPDNDSETFESLESIVKFIIPSAICTSQVAGEIIFSLPIQSVPSFALLFEALGKKSKLLGVESYGVSLTSLEQVFIKLAKEKELVMDEAPPKSISTMLRNAAGRVMRIISPGSSYLQELPSALSTPKRKSSDPSKVLPRCNNNCELDDESKSDNVTQTVPQSLSMTTNGLAPSMTTITALTDETDMESRRSCEESSFNPGQLPSKCEAAESTRDSNLSAITLPGTEVRKEKNSNFSPRDNAATSDPGSSNSWSIDISLHSGESRPSTPRYTPMSSHPKEVDGEESQDNDHLKTSETETDSEEKDDVEATHTGDIRTQVIELLRKRLITSSRDLKGLFFQVLFPAIQILLILAILTININPAGRTLKMNASMFKFKPNTIISGRISPESIDSDFSTSRLILNRYNATTSKELSIDLLQSGNVLFQGAKALRASLPPSDRRLGAIVLKDKLEVAIDVDWTWVKRNVDGLLSVKGVDAIILSTFGIDTHEATSSRSVVVPAPLINNALQLLKNTSTSAGTFNQTIIKRIRNSKVFNSTLTGDQQSATVRFDGISSSKEGLLFSGVEIERGGYSVNLGNVLLSSAEIKSLLPGRIIEYKINVPFPYTIMHNSSSPHGIAAFRGEVVTATFQQCYANLNITRKSGIAAPQIAYLAKNHPLPLTARQSLQNRVILSLLASLFILVPLCYIPASFITFIVRERMSKAKHLQLVSSVSPYVYWCATYLWDIMLFSVLVLLIIAALFIYGKNAAQVFISVDEATYAVFLLLFTYGLSVLPLCYLYSMLFDNHSTAQISIMAINFATGFVAVLAYFVMNTVPTTQEAAQKIVHFFRFFPPYNIGEGLISIAAAFYGNTLLGSKISYFAWEVTGRSITFMIIEAIGYFGMVLVTESFIYRQLGTWIERKRALIALNKVVVTNTADVDGIVIPSNYKDEDVLFEEESVRNTDRSQLALCIENLVKIYPSSFLAGKAKHAVRGLTLGCRVGERLGFLGVNGAGKSTTLGVLTGDIAPTGGEVYIGGMPLSDPKTRQAIGYCPQTDPLFDLMTAKETLWFYGRIRGIKAESLVRKVDKLIKQVGLTKFADRTSGTYSGGNKRKLSLAISLIGSPKVLLLDEPSSGMDPFARRQMWDLIAAVSEQRSVVLTTHSMEECEALCTRIGIMVDGSLRCLGPSSHLKARFANGYQIEVRFSAEDRFDDMMSLLRGICEDIEIDERHGQFLRLKVPTLDLGQAFSSLEKSKVSPTGCVVDYTVCQNTLEQVFLKFAKMQEQVEGVEEHHVDVVTLGV